MTVSACDAPTVSVVIPAYNCARYLAPAIESVLAQSHRPLEIIVVDDASTDDTAVVLAGYTAVTAVRRPNGGVSAARNTGIRRARGEYVAFLDGDDIWPPEKLREQVEFVRDRPEVGLLFGDARRFGDDGWTEPSLFHRYGLTVQYFGHDYLVTQPVAKLLRMNFIPTGTVLVRRSALLQAGLFDEELRRSEDWDMWMRVALHHPIGYSQRLWKLKRSHSTNLSNDTEAIALAALAVLHKLEQSFRADPPVCGLRVGPQLRQTYQNLGYFYLRQLRLRAARRALRRSLAYGIRMRSALYLGATFLGQAPVAAVLRARG